MDSRVRDSTTSLVTVIEHAECSMITLIRDVAPQRVNASLAKT
jgi:hypothetical protein